MFHIKLFVLTFFVLCSFSTLSEPENDEEKQSFVASEKDLKKIKAAMDNIKPNLEMEKRAKELKAYTQSQEYIERQKKYETSLASILELDSPIEKEAVQLTDTDQLILFVSSSMPIEVLRRYAKQVDKVGGLMVLRGTLGDGTHIQPTLDFLTEVLKKDKNCSGIRCDILGTYLTVDPRLFRLNNIKQVPALVFSEDLNLVNYASEKEVDNSFPSSANFVVYGDATLLGMVREILRKTKNEKLKAYVKKLQKL